MQQLVDEVYLAGHQLVQVQQLADECEKLRDTPERRDKGQLAGDLSRPTDEGGLQAASTDIPSPTSVEGEDPSGREGTHSSRGRGHCSSCGMCAAGTAHVADIPSAFMLISTSSFIHCK